MKHYIAPAGQPVHRADHTGYRGHRTCTADHVDHTTRTDCADTTARTACNDLADYAVPIARITRTPPLHAGPRRVLTQSLPPLLLPLLLLSLLLLSACHRASAPRRPLVGISCSHQGGRSMLSRNYTESVARLGGTPVLIPVTTDSLALADLVAQLDGLILSGGGDVHPAYYGQEPLPELGEVDSLRDAGEFLLVRLALHRNLPMLGICRGEQLLNVALGGTLWQDIPSQTADTTVRHNQLAPSTVATHRVRVLPGSLLHQALGRDSLWTNTHHHQAVRRVAPTMRVVAWADDSIPEAIEATDGRPIYAVQFHPEALTMGGDTLAPRIIGAFLQSLAL